QVCAYKPGSPGDKDVFLRIVEMIGFLNVGVVEDIFQATSFKKFVQKLFSPVHFLQAKVVFPFIEMIASYRGIFRIKIVEGVPEYSVSLGLKHLFKFFVLLD